ncbi:MAG: DUF4365 domain-containing protein, partial [Bacteroidia bacterium]|nr:DUF4365 domain-containing protein [Bacteroidia bacterium]
MNNILLNFGCSMVKLLKHKAIPHSKTSSIEKASVVTFESIVDPDYIRCDIKTQDKHPNIDGYLDITDKNGSFRGKLEVQIKTLNSKNLLTPSFQADLRFVSYCEDSFSPVLLIVMNKKEQVGYWIYIDKELVTSISKVVKENQKTIKIIFPKKNKLSHKSKSYLKPWKTIIEDRKKLFESAHTLGKENEKLRLE